MYRNVVLTVIAVCLLWICARDVAPWLDAGAAQPALKGTKAEPVPVVIQSDDRSPLPVKIDFGRGRGLGVIIEDVRGGAFRSAGPIEVRQGR